MNSVNDINLKYLCTGCGACAAICPMDAIEMERKDIYYPKVNKSKCVECGKCVDVCPGVSIFVKSMANNFWPDNTYDFELGRFRATFIGYSNDPKIRFHATSGGIATSLIIGLLRRKLIDGAIVTRMSSKNPLHTESIIARKEEEVIAACTSKYCPTSPVALLKELKNSGKREKFVFVGLPCQIHGIRKLQSQAKWAQEKIYLTVGLFCSHSVTFRGTHVLLNKFAKRIQGIERIQYRGRGWPGGITVNYSNGETINIPLDKYWQPMFAPYFFTPYRCLSCHDMSSELADISLGDAWLKEVRKNDHNKGVSIIIVRSDFGGKLLSNVRKSNEIILKEIPYNMVIESQKGILARKKQGIGARLKLFKMLHRDIPKYDQKFKASYTGYIGAILTFFSAVCSRTLFGAKAIEIVPVRFLKKYCSYVYKYSGR